MNIVDVVISEAKAQANQCLFNINCILSDPTKDNTVEKLTDMLDLYNLYSERVVSAERLKKEMENSPNENQNNPNNS